jgi:hypothetical protein
MLKSSGGVLNNLAFDLLMLEAELEKEAAKATASRGE